MGALWMGAAAGPIGRALPPSRDDLSRGGGRRSDPAAHGRPPRRRSKPAISLECVHTYHDMIDADALERSNDSADNPSRPLRCVARRGLSVPTGLGHRPEPCHPMVVGESARVARAILAGAARSAFGVEHGRRTSALRRRSNGGFWRSSDSRRRCATWATHWAPTSARRPCENGGLAVCHPLSPLTG
jgi:hypothetical protein